MFSDLTCILLNNSDILIYNKDIAGLFNTDIMDANAAIHRTDNRKLSDGEIVQLLDTVDKITQEEEIQSRKPTEQEILILNGIQLFYPKIKFVIKSFLIDSAKKPTNKDKEKQKNRAKKRAAKRKAKKSKPNQKPEDLDPEDIDPEDIDPDETEIDEELGNKLKNLDFKLFDEEEDKKDKKAEEDKKEEEDIDKERKENVKKAEDDLKKSGMGDKKYKGFLGLLFNTYKSLEDPKTKREREELRDRLHRDWKMYQDNKVILKQNEKLIQSLQQAQDKGEITPDSISVMNELIGRDAKFAKNIEFEQDPKTTVKVEQLKYDISKYLKDDAYDEKDIEKALNKLLKEDNIKGTLLYDSETQEVQLKADWDNSLKFIQNNDLKYDDIENL